MIERVARFGPVRKLVGITCEPRGEATVPGPVFLLMNAGILHRVGPHRMNVEFSRRLAAAGFRSFRFDLSGQGDSAARDQTEADDDTDMADLHDAMDLLATRWNADRFVVIGLCSGAFLAHRAAAVDSRVVGAVFLDGYGYVTSGHRLRAPLQLATNPRRISNFARRVVREIAGGDESGARAAVAEEDADLPVFDEPFPPQEQTTRELEQMLDEGKHLLFIYSGGVSEYFNHRDQFGEMYGDLESRGDVDLEFYEEADHLYYWTPNRNRLIDRVVDWASDRFGATKTTNRR